MASLAINNEFLARVFQNNPQGLEKFRTVFASSGDLNITIDADKMAHCAKHTESVLLAANEEYNAEELSESMPELLIKAVADANNRKVIKDNGYSEYVRHLHNTSRRTTPQTLSRSGSNSPHGSTTNVSALLIEASVQLRINKLLDTAEPLSFSDQLFELNKDTSKPGSEAFINTLSPQEAKQILTKITQHLATIDYKSDDLGKNDLDRYMDVVYPFVSAIANASDISNKITSLLLLSHYYVRLGIMGARGKLSIAQGLKFFDEANTLLRQHPQNSGAAKENQRFFPWSSEEFAAILSASNHAKKTLPSAFACCLIADQHNLKTALSSLLGKTSAEMLEVLKQVALVTVIDERNNLSSLFVYLVSNSKSLRLTMRQVFELVATQTNRCTEEEFNHFAEQVYSHFKNEFKDYYLGSLAWFDLSDNSEQTNWHRAALLRKILLDPSIRQAAAEKLIKNLQSAYHVPPALFIKTLTENEELLNQLIESHPIELLQYSLRNDVVESHRKKIHDIIAERVRNKKIQPLAKEKLEAIIPFLATATSSLQDQVVPATQLKINLKALAAFSSVGLIKIDEFKAHGIRLLQSFLKDLKAQKEISPVELQYAIQLLASIQLQGLAEELLFNNYVKVFLSLYTREGVSKESLLKSLGYMFQGSLGEQCLTIFAETNFVSQVIQDGLFAQLLEQFGEPQRLINFVKKFQEAKSAILTHILDPDLANVFIGKETSYEALLTECEVSSKAITEQLERVNSLKKPFGFSILEILFERLSTEQKDQLFDHFIKVVGVTDQNEGLIKLLLIYEAKKVANQLASITPDTTREVKTIAINNWHRFKIIVNRLSQLVPDTVLAIFDFLPKNQPDAAHRLAIAMLQSPGYDQADLIKIWRALPEGDIKHRAAVSICRIASSSEKAKAEEKSNLLLLDGLTAYEVFSNLVADNRINPSAETKKSVQYCARAILTSSLSEQYDSLKLNAVRNNAWLLDQNYTLDLSSKPLSFQVMFLASALKSSQAERYREYFLELWQSNVLTNDQRKSLAFQLFAEPNVSIPKKVTVEMAKLLGPVEISKKFLLLVVDSQLDKDSKAKPAEIISLALNLLGSITELGLNFKQAFEIFEALKSGKIRSDITPELLSIAVTNLVQMNSWFASADGEQIHQLYTLGGKDAKALIRAALQQNLSTQRTIFLDFLKAEQYDSIIELFDEATIVSYWKEIFSIQPNTLEAFTKFLLAKSGKSFEILKLLSPILLKNRTTLVLSESKDHCRTLFDVLADTSESFNLEDLQDIVRAADFTQVELFTRRKTIENQNCKDALDKFIDYSQVSTLDGQATEALISQRLKDESILDQPEKYSSAWFLRILSSPNLLEMLGNPDVAEGKSNRQTILNHFARSANLKEIQDFIRDSKVIMQFSFDELSYFFRALNDRPDISKQIIAEAYGLSHILRSKPEENTSSIKDAVISAINNWPQFLFEIISEDMRDAVIAHGLQRAPFVFCLQLPLFIDQLNQPQIMKVFASTAFVGEMKNSSDRQWNRLKVISLFESGIFKEKDVVIREFLQKLFTVPDNVISDDVLNFIVYALTESDDNATKTRVDNLILEIASQLNNQNRVLQAVINQAIDAKLKVKFFAAQNKSLTKELARLGFSGEGYFEPQNEKLANYIDVAAYTIGELKAVCLPVPMSTANTNLPLINSKYKASISVYLLIKKVNDLDLQEINSLFKNLSEQQISALIVELIEPSASQESRTRRLTNSLRLTSDNRPKLQELIRLTLLKCINNPSLIADDMFEQLFGLDDVISSKVFTEKFAYSSRLRKLLISGTDEARAKYQALFVASSLSLSSQQHALEILALPNGGLLSTAAFAKALSNALNPWERAENIPLLERLLTIGYSEEKQNILQHKLFAEIDACSTIETLSEKTSSIHKISLPNLVSNLGEQRAVASTASTEREQNLEREKKSRWVARALFNREEALVIGSSDTVSKLIGYLTPFDLNVLIKSCPGLKSNFKDFLQKNEGVIREQYLKETNLLPHLASMLAEVADVTLQTDLGRLQFFARNLPVAKLDSLIASIPSLRSNLCVEICKNLSQYLGLRQLVEREELINWLFRQELTQVSIQNIIGTLAQKAFRSLREKILAVHLHVESSSPYKELIAKTVLDFTSDDSKQTDDIASEFFRNSVITSTPLIPSAATSAPDVSNSTEPQSLGISTSRSVPSISISYQVVRPNLVAGLEQATITEFVGQLLGPNSSGYQKMQLQHAIYAIEYPRVAVTDDPRYKLHTAVRENATDKQRPKLALNNIRKNVPFGIVLADMERITPENYSVKAQEVSSPIFAEMIKNPEYKFAVEVNLLSANPSPRLKQQIRQHYFSVDPNIGVNVVGNSKGFVQTFRDSFAAQMDTEASTQNYIMHSVYRDLDESNAQRKAVNLAAEIADLVRAKKGFSESLAVFNGVANAYGNRDAVFEALDSVELPSFKQRAAKWCAKMMPLIFRRSTVVNLAEIRSIGVPADVRRQSADNIAAALAPKSEVIPSTAEPQAANDSSPSTVVPADNDIRPGFAYTAGMSFHPIPKTVNALRDISDTLSSAPRPGANPGNSGG